MVTHIENQTSNIKNSNRFVEMVKHLLRFRLTGVVFKVDVQPDRTRQAEDVNKKQGADGDQCSEGGRRAPSQHPVQEENEEDAEPCRKDVGDEHGAVVKAGFRHKILPAVGAFSLHVKGFVKAEGSRFEEVLLMALGTFHTEDAVGFRPFSENAHVYYQFLPAAPAVLNN